MVNGRYKKITFYKDDIASHYRVCFVAEDGKISGYYPKGDSEYETKDEFECDNKIIQLNQTMAREARQNLLAGVMNSLSINNPMEDINEL